MRLIDGDALIEQIETNICKPCKERKEDYHGVRCRACQYGDEIDDIDDAPTVMEWIPCSERLPKEYGEYRITWTTSASKKRLIGDCEFEVTSEWDAERYRFKGKWLLDEYIKNYPDVNVIAWKPLEEPWEGGEDAVN